MPETGVIRLKLETRKRLAELGKKGETYDQIINRLIEFYKANLKRGRRRLVE
jgi:predicted DNA-binding protein